MRTMLTALAVLVLAGSAVAQMPDYTMYSEISSLDIPPDCEMWHEIAPEFCNLYHQDEYIDNGDGEISVCDIIVLNGEQWHVEWVGPAVEDDAGDWYEWEDPAGDVQLEVCDILHELSPEWCTFWHVTAVLDIGSTPLVLDPGDHILFDDPEIKEVEVTDVTLAVKLIKYKVEGIPTVSEWGLIILALMLTAAGCATVVRMRRKAIA